MSDLGQNTCPYCGKSRKGTNVTCGDTRCRSTASSETRSENELRDQLHYMRKAYGDKNPWTEWLRKAMRGQHE